jgi:large subunit ribosomal protein L24
MHIKAGDTVQVIRGEQRGERGEVQRVYKGQRSSRQAEPSKDRVVVAGINLVTKHQRRTGNIRTQTGRIEREAPIHISNVMLVCPQCSKPTRVAHEFASDGSKSRVCKKCGSAID